MRLTHTDGRVQDIPDSAWTKHAATYQRAGWFVEQADDTIAQEQASRAGLLRIVSRHNAERYVSPAEFDETYKPAGWKTFDERQAEIAASEEATKPVSPKSSAKRA